MFVRDSDGPKFRETVLFKIVVFISYRQHLVQSLVSNGVDKRHKTYKIHLNTSYF